DYDLRDNLQSVTEAAGQPESQTSSFTYDALNRAVTMVAAAGSRDAATTVQAYDLVGNLVAMTEAAGNPEARTTTYEYDNLNRAITMSVGGSGPDAPRVTRMAYDVFDNATDVIKSA